MAGEANVAASLVNFDMQAAYLTVLPNSDIGDECVRELRKWNVETSHILRAPGRMGLYFLEAGANQRPSKVIYDREFSAIALAKQSDINWEKISSGIDWFHQKIDILAGLFPPRRVAVGRNTPGIPPSPPFAEKIPRNSYQLFNGILELVSQTAFQVGSAPKTRPKRSGIVRIDMRATWM